MKPKVTFNPSRKSFKIEPTTSPHLIKLPKKITLNQHKSLTNNFFLGENYNFFAQNRIKQKIKTNPSQILSEGVAVRNFSDQVGNSGVVKANQPDPIKFKKLMNEKTEKAIFQFEGMNTITKAIEQIDRPHYEKRFSSPFYKKQKNPFENVKRAKKESCFIPLCWIILAILGLTAIVLGMLFGLGVIGGKNLNDFATQQTTLKQIKTNEKVKIKKEVEKNKTKQVVVNTLNKQNSDAKNSIKYRDGKEKEEKTPLISNNQSKVNRNKKVYKFDTSKPQTSKKNSQNQQRSKLETGFMFPPKNNDFGIIKTVQETIISEQKNGEKGSVTAVQPIEAFHQKKLK